MNKKIKINNFLLITIFSLGLINNIHAEENAAIISDNLDIYIPSAKYQSEQGVTQKLWGNLKFLGKDTDGNLTWKLDSYGIESANPSNTTALLMIGASYESGKTRIDDDKFASLNGMAVGYGDYLALGDAYIREKMSNGLVVNEANVGNTTFNRPTCLYDSCLPGGDMFGYNEQFERALLRVAIYNPEDPTVINGYNAKFLFIGIPNDCIHSDALGVPQKEARPCDIDKVNETVNGVVKVANKASDLGITPIIALHPEYHAIDLPLVKKALNLEWVANESEYNLLRNEYSKRVKTEVRNVIVLELWENFKHRGDGIHPSRQTVMKAAKKLAETINLHFTESTIE